MISRVYIRWIFEKKIDRRTMLNQYAVDNPTLPVNRRFFPLFRDAGGMLSRSLGMPSRNDGPPCIWDTHGKPGNVFANPMASSSAPYPHVSNPWISNVSEHTSPHVMSESQTTNTALNPRCQSGPSARNWIATCSCETSRELLCSRAREEDRESSSSKSTSCRLAAK